MSAIDSNLSGPAFGYDLVCAVTESGLNATILDLLAQESEESSVCWAVDNSNDTVQVPLSQIEDAIGQDPFSIPDGTDWNAPVMDKLSSAGFLYAFKAKLGLPQGVALNEMPNVIQLDKGNSQVTYQLFFAEFSVIILNY